MVLRLHVQAPRDDLGHRELGRESNSQVYFAVLKGSSARINQAIKAGYGSDARN